MISLHDVTVTLPPRSRSGAVVLSHVSLEIPPGKWLALAGPNGSGKTTLLHTMAGLIPPAAGTVRLRTQVGNVPAGKPRIALLLQEPDNQFVTTTVRHELMLSLPPDAGDAAARTARIERAVERFALGDFLERNPHRLSGGEKQRLSLATVWLQDPNLLLLDEPIAHLDAEGASKCVGFLRELHRDGVTIVWATPGGEELAFAEELVCVNGGKTQFHGVLDDMYPWAEGAAFDYVRPREREMAERLAAAFTEEGVRRAILDAGRVGAGALARALLDRVPALPHQSPPAARRNRIESGDVAVRFAGASFRYDETAAVQDLELELRFGECVGITGPNGAGKSTILALAAGMHEPQAGAIERPARAGRHRAFLLFQMPERLFFAETVAEELAFGLERLGLDRGERERRSRDALARVGLPPDAFLPRAPLSLSAGEMRRVAFAILLSLDAGLVLLDEPTSCLDSAGRELLAGIIADETGRGHAVMIASHDVGFLVRVCDRIAWVRRGRLDAMVSVGGGDLPPDQEWPGEPLAVLGLQDHLAALGAPVVPRALTEERLLERL